MHLSDFQEFAQKYKTSTTRLAFEGKYFSSLQNDHFQNGQRNKQKLNLGDKNIQNQTPKSYNRV